MLSTTIVLFTLLIIASFCHQLAKYLKLPYTIFLFIVGILLVPLNNLFGWDFVETLSLTPELLFFVFLPVLIFEAGYHIKYKQLTKNYVPIRTLAIAGLALSTAIVGRGGWWLLGVIGIQIPLEVMLLFGVIISSTDPVAVLSIFKDLGVPKRLGLIFEGESLFNDGIAVAVFLVMLEIFQVGVFQTSDIRSGVADFAMMVVGGIILGTLMGMLFSQGIKGIKNNEHVEITLTMVLAHVVFLLAEYITHFVEIGEINLKISGVIATAYAAIIMGNYGKTKISPKVEAYMDKFWSFFSFVTNSLVFLLMGMMVKYIALSWDILGPALLVTIGLLIIGRAISIYLPLGLVSLVSNHALPSKRQHLLAWGSLRGALGLMLVLLIPDNFSPAGWNFDVSAKSFILALTICSIMFSLIVRGLSIKSLIKKLNINGLADLEEFELLESHVMVYDRIVKKIKELSITYNISPQQSEELIHVYQTKKEIAKTNMQIFLDNHHKKEELITTALTLHALGIEKEELHEMYSYNEISEQIFYSRSAKIETQAARVQAGNPQIRGFKSPTDIRPTSRYPIERLLHWLNKCDAHDEHNEYIISRTKFIVTENVLQDLKILRKIDFGYDKKYIDSVITLYKKFHLNARKEMERLGAHDQDFVDSINAHLLTKSIMKSEEQLIEDLYHKDMITEGIYKQFQEEINTEIWKQH